MGALNTRPEPVQRAQTFGATVERPAVQIPMSQQSLLGSHGHDMHPQEFVRLSGCQEERLRIREAALLPH
jgi:hypothetical protein